MAIPHQSRSVTVEKVAGIDDCAQERLSLPEGGIALYLLDLSVPTGAESSRKLLSPDELERAARFHFDRDRQRYCATRALLRTLLGGYVGAPPQQLSFQYSDKGKPALAPPVSDLAFNVSHSGEFALLGFARASHIGVDIEKIKIDFDTAAIAQRFFSAREQSDLLGLASDQRHHAFFRCWTRKEAFIKALGEGLSHPLSQFDVSLNAVGPVSLATRPDAAESERWSLQSVEAGPGYAAAFAVSTG